MLPFLKNTSSVSSSESAWLAIVEFANSSAKFWTNETIEYLGRSLSKADRKTIFPCLLPIIATLFKPKYFEPVLKRIQSLQLGSAEISESPKGATTDDVRIMDTLEVKNTITVLDRYTTVQIAPIFDMELMTKESIINFARDFLACIWKAPTQKLSSEFDSNIALETYYECWLYVLTQLGMSSYNFGNNEFMAPLVDSTSQIPINYRIEIASIFLIRFLSSSQILSGSVSLINEAIRNHDTVFELIVLNLAIKNISAIDKAPRLQEFYNTLANTFFFKLTSEIPSITILKKLDLLMSRVKGLMLASQSSFIVMKQYLEDFETVNLSENIFLEYFTLAVNFMRYSQGLNWPAQPFWAKILSRIDDQSELVKVNCYKIVCANFASNSCCSHFGGLPILRDDTVLFLISLGFKSYYTEF